MIPEKELATDINVAAKVESTHGNNRHGRAYRLAIEE